MMLGLRIFFLILLTFTFQVQASRLSLFKIAHQYYPDRSYHEHPKEYYWISVVSSTTWGHFLGCANSPCWIDGKKKKGTTCCRLLEPRYNRWWHDGHIWLPIHHSCLKNLRKANWGSVANPGLYLSQCHFIYDEEKQTLEPEGPWKGLWARLWLYLFWAYDWPLQPSELMQYRTWHHEYPMSSWEQFWHDVITKEQGTHFRIE